jgi:hypothetical protein
MPSRYRFNGCLAILARIVCSVGCSPGLRVTEIQLGRSLNSDATVGDTTASFGPGDTVYLSVATDGFGSGTIGVRWTYAGRLVDEPKKQVSYRGAAVTEFHLQSADGFPPGQYAAEVFLNGTSVGSRAFRVARP